MNQHFREDLSLSMKSSLTKRDPLENVDSVFEFISNFATLNPSFICYCEIRSRNANKG